jgi:hypothetical protein
MHSKEDCSGQPNPTFPPGCRRRIGPTGTKTVRESMGLSKKDKETLNFSWFFILSVVIYSVKQALFRDCIHIFTFMDKWRF